MRPPVSIAVVADANGFMMPFQFHFNLDRELGRLLGDYELVVPRAVLQELEALAREHRSARAALELARRCRIVDAPGGADEALVAIARRLQGVALTNDRGMIAALRASGIPVVRLGDRSRLIYEGPFR